MADRGRRIEPLPRVPAPAKTDAGGAPASEVVAEPTDPRVRVAAPRLPTNAILGDPSELAPARAEAPIPVVSHVPAAARPVRARYVPPKLGAPLPRALRLDDPLSPLVSQWLASIVRTLRGIHMYADNNARRREYFEQTVVQLAQILARTPLFTVEVLEDRITFAGDVVHFCPDRFEGLPILLHGGGVRQVRLRHGVSRIEVLRFLGVLSTDLSLAEHASEDLVTLAERLGLTHVELVGDGRSSILGPTAPAAPRPREAALAPSPSPSADVARAA
ncbi:hypothetical protein L6R52_41480, partial [Myxococcota bacterium]|nr:hypothetical protein [Myxococcota bacterium]